MRGSEGEALLVFLQELPEPGGHTVNDRSTGLCLVFPWGVQNEVFPIISVGLNTSNQE